jgi:hypothetical protein
MPQSILGFEVAVLTKVLAAAVPAFLPYVPSASDLSNQAPGEYMVCYE